MRRAVFWFTLVVIAAGILVGGLELILQAGALLVRATGRELPVAWTTDEVRVLCLGDSNTYGVYLPRRDSWPSQLEASWNETVETPKLEVFNLGYPGMNSSRLRSDFTRLLDTFRPQVIVVMIGANDYWTVPSALTETPASPTWLDRIERGSRLYRLVYMLISAYPREELETPPPPLAGGREKQALRREFVFGDESFEVGMVRETRRTRGKKRSALLRDNLRDLVERARAHATPIVLMTYPTQEKRGFYARASLVTARAAEESDVPLVDLRSAFARQCPDVACAELLFPDRHPRAGGYRIVANEVTRVLANILRTSADPKSPPRASPPATRHE